MVNVVMEGEPHKYWATKDFWSDRDLLYLCWGGLEHLTECDTDEFNRMRNKINQAVVSGELKEEKTIAGDVFFKRDTAVKWANENLKHFPFEPEDFFPVPPKKKRPGTDREETQLRMIGALALLLAEECDDYKKGSGIPNNNKITNAVLALFEHLQEQSPELKGLGKSSFHSAIGQGLKLLFE